MLDFKTLTSKGCYYQGETLITTFVVGNCSKVPIDSTHISKVQIL